MSKISSRRTITFRAEVDLFAGDAAYAADYVGRLPMAGSGSFFIQPSCNVEQGGWQDMSVYFSWTLLSGNDFSGYEGGVVTRLMILNLNAYRCEATLHGHSSRTTSTRSASLSFPIEPKNRTEPEQFFLTAEEVRGLRARETQLVLEGKCTWQLDLATGIDGDEDRPIRGGDRRR